MDAASPCLSRQRVPVFLSDENFSYRDYIASQNFEAFAANPLHWPLKLKALENILKLESEVRSGEDKSAVYCSKGQTHYFDKNTLLALPDMSEALFIAFKEVGILTGYKDTSEQKHPNMTAFFAVSDLGKVLYRAISEYFNQDLGEQTLILPLIREAQAPIVPKPVRTTSISDSVRVKLTNPKACLVDFLPSPDQMNGNLLANPLIEARNVDLLGRLLMIETDFRGKKFGILQGPMKLDDEEVYIPVSQIQQTVQGLDTNLLNVFLKVGILEPLSKHRPYEVQSLAVTDFGKLLWRQYCNGIPNANDKYVFLPEVAGATQI